MTANVYSALTGCHLRAAPAPAPVVQESPTLATEGVYDDVPAPAPYAEGYSAPVPAPVDEELPVDVADGPAPCTGNETGDAAVVPAPTPAQQEAPVVDDERPAMPPNPVAEMEQRTAPRRSINTLGD